MKEQNKIEEIPFEEAEYCVFDFETTGTSARTDKVIEIGMAKIIKGKIVDTFSSFINPGRPIPFYITNLTGITNYDVEDAPFFDEVYHRIKSFAGDAILVAHNLQFDIAFLRNECLNSENEMLPNESICTLKLARKVFPTLQSKSLGSVVKHLKIRHRDVHRGLGDATATAKILVRMFIELREQFNIDSVSDLISFQSPSSSKTFTLVKKKLVDDLANVPDKPGVYFFKNAQGKIIYIGKAKSLKDRVRNHFMNTAIRKSKRIVQAASSLDFKVTNSELTALLAEAELIKVHNPRFNTLLKKFPVSYFIKIRTEHDYPSVETASEFNFDGNDYYGPYPNRKSVTETKEIIDKTFQLRECSDKELNKNKKCYLSDIKRCITPCIETITDEYIKELENVHDFLSGNNQSAVDRLLNKMKALSEKQKFEEAAEVRDVVQRILSQLLRSSILSEPLNRANVLIEINANPKNDYILLLNGKIYLKNFFVDEKDEFTNALEGYFTKIMFINKEITEKDLERIKISLSWLIKNRTAIKIHYLKNYISIEEVFANLLFAESY